MNGFKIERTAAIQDSHGHWTLYVMVHANSRTRVYMRSVPGFPVYDDYLHAIKANRPLDRPAARQAFPGAIL
jgi:hypothetical protein